jgi:Peptide methionine sulfoxide reductase
MSGNVEKAILAGGCFWGVQDLIRKRPGVISTRVGYTGGDVPNATYRHHGSHAEAIEIIFDPAQISYRDLLEFFFQIHDHRRCGRLGPVAGQGGHRGGARRAVLGGRAGAPGLPGEVPGRLHLPLRPAGLEATAPRGPGRPVTGHAAQQRGMGLL